MIQILLVFIVLHGDPHTFAVTADSTEQCKIMESTATTWLPRVLKQKPEFFAVKCAEVTPYLTAT